ncbi:hypothetical protein O3M35_000365 [Rhynocoris fuscipes]|uniref:Uncharacterized protein n=1 Tax=Rhynocoris fuscipes TaxID=488301 RepID=A0AAW1DSF8_9HEMI
MTSPSRPAAEHTEDQIVGELKSLSVMERSRRYGVVNSPTGLLAPIGKRRLPSPCSPDSALGSDDENGKSARNNDRTLNRGTDSAENADEDDDEEEEPDDIVCDGIREEPKARTLRTPSVVISDHSDDPFMATSTLTLDEIERIRAEYESDPIRRRSSSANNTGGDSGSDCSATSSWSSWGLDPDYALRSQRKTSDCSTCSTLSGEDDDTLQPVILQQVKVKKVCYLSFNYKNLLTIHV